MERPPATSSEAAAPLTADDINKLRAARLAAEHEYTQADGAFLRIQELILNLQDARVHQRRAYGLHGWQPHSMDKSIYLSFMASAFMSAAFYGVIVKDLHLAHVHEFPARVKDFIGTVRDKVTALEACITYSEDNCCELRDGVGAEQILLLSGGVLSASAKMAIDPALLAGAAPPAHVQGEGEAGFDVTSIVRQAINAGKPEQVVAAVLDLVDALEQQQPAAHAALASLSQQNIGQLFQNAAAP